MRTKRKRKYRNKKTRKNIVSKLVREILKDKKSYSPLIRERVRILNPKTPAINIFNVQECGKYDIPLTLKNGKYKCLKWDSKEAQKVMLNNLYNKNKINAREVIAPKQVESNCWFNSFFMVFFISDKGRKFLEYMRNVMITGKLPSGRKVKKNIRKPLWLLNRYINASIIGTNDPVLFALRMDTNNIIRGLYPILKKTKKTIKGLSKGDIIEKTKRAANPLDYYLRLLHNLEETSISHIHFENMKFENIKRELENLSHIPELIIIEAFDLIEKNKFTERITINKNKIKYKLDSAILRSTNGEHFTAYLTINKKDYMFDGERYQSPSKYGKLAQKTITRFDWKKKIMNNDSWKPEPNNPEKFSFSNEYKVLLYYLDSKK